MQARLGGTPLPQAVSRGGGGSGDDESPYLHTWPLGGQGRGGVRPCLPPLGAPALGGLARLMEPGWGVAVPAQPADFQAEADSDTRIQLSWLLPPQERIVKYELVYWAAEDEGQQVSTQQCGGRTAAPSPWGVCAGLSQVGFPGFWGRGHTAPSGAGTRAGLCGSVVFVTPLLGTEPLSPSWVSSALWLAWHQQSPQVPRPTCPWCSHAHVVSEVPLRGPYGHVAGSQPRSHGGSPGIRHNPCSG